MDMAVKQLNGIVIGGSKTIATVAVLNCIILYKEDLL